MTKEYAKLFINGELSPEVIRGVFSEKIETIREVITNSDFGFFV